MSAPGDSSGGASPRVAIVLINWNSWRDTIECLESLFRLDYEPFSVIVCDQASADGSADRIREWAAGRFAPTPATNPQLADLSSPPVPKPIPIVEYSRAEAESGAAPRLDVPLVLIHTGANLGCAGGNNVALRFLLGQPGVKYVWILNNDIVVAADSLTELVRCAESDETIGAVAGQLLDYRDPSLIQAAGGGKLSSWRGFPIPQTRLRANGDGGIERLDWVTGGNQLSPMSEMRRVGILDEDYFLYMEDIDHCVRFRQAGLKLVFAPKSRVWHKGGATVGHHSPSHDYYMVRNALMMARKYHPRMMPFVHLYTFYRCVLPKVVRGQWARLRTIRRAYSDYRSGTVGKAQL